MSPSHVHSHSIKRENLYLTVNLLSPAAGLKVSLPLKTKKKSCKWKVQVKRHTDAKVIIIAPRDLAIWRACRVEMRSMVGIPWVTEASIWGEMQT